MAHVRRLATCLLLLVICVPALAAGKTQDPDRLGTTVVPVSQRVELTLDAGKRDYTGTTSVTLKVVRKTGSFRLHAEQMELKRVELRGTTGPIRVSHQTGELGLLTLTAAVPLEPGSYTLDIDFANEFDTRAVGLYRMEQDGEGYLFTQFEAEDARKAFPCWDEPSFKIPWQINLTIPEAHAAVANTPLATETVKDGMRTMVFATTKPLPSYLLAIAAGPLETIPIEDLGVPGRVVTVKGRSSLGRLAAAITPPLLREMEAWFGGPYPFEKLDLIAIPEYWPGAMENPGAITFADTLLLVDEASASVGQKRNLARVMSHELAHMWFGDLVTMSWWDDLWLNESFADWMGDKIAAKVHPELNFELSELQGIQGTMIADARPSAQPVRRPVLARDNKIQNVGTAYNKGKSVLAMFEQWIGPEKFRAGVLRYLEQHAWGNATADDLWRALSAASGQNVGPALATFIEQGGLPMVTVEPHARGQIRLSQKRYLPYGTKAPDQRWKIPVRIRYSDGRQIWTVSMMLDQPFELFRLEGTGQPVWMLPDADAAGYYRWNVPAAMLSRMAGDAADSLSPAERIGFIGNLRALLYAGAIRGDAYLESLGHFAAETQPQVLSALVTALSTIRMSLVTDEMAGVYAGWIRQTIGPALDRIGLERKPGEDEAVSLVRPQLLQLLGDEGKDARVLEHARKLAAAYMADPAGVDPSLAGVALQLAALTGDAGLQEEFRKRAEAAKSPVERSRYLSAFASFRDPALIDVALKYTLGGALRGREMMQIVREIGVSARERDQRYRFLIDNYDTIVARLPGPSAGFMPFFASGCEAERLEAARKFFSDPAHKVAGTDTSLAQVTDQVNDCIGLRQREAASVAAYLKSQNVAGQ